MASPREIFGLSGPLHLTAVDWKSIHHRRSIAASLVQGVYILERDRQQQRQGPQALAPPWWDFFHFQLLRVLVDDTDGSFFGAVYEFKFPPSYYNYNAPNTPRYVIAFRGTITKPDSRSQDLKLDLGFILNRLEQSSRFHHAMQAVQHITSTSGASSVWLAGHSLGSAIALLAGKNMVKTSNYLIETYLFNPPFFSAPLERMKNEKLKHGVRFLSSVVTAGVAVALKTHQQKPHQTDSFSVLSSWIPYLFVNPSDPLCSEYIGYFDHRGKMVEFGAGGIGRLATQHSLGSLLLGARREPLHLLPSAYLTINRSPSQDFKQAHGIHQWWRSDNHYESRMHHYRTFSIKGDDVNIKFTLLMSISRTDLWAPWREKGSFSNRLTLTGIRSSSLSR